MTTMTTQGYSSPPSTVYEDRRGHPSIKCLDRGHQQVWFRALTGDVERQRDLDGVADGRQPTELLHEQAGQGLVVTRRADADRARRCASSTCISPGNSQPSWRRTASFSVASCSSAISPTSSSAMSSTVTIPAKPPYSSITNAISSPAVRNCFEHLRKRQRRRHTHRRPAPCLGRGLRVGVEHSVQVDDAQQIIGGVADDGVAGVSVAMRVSTALTDSSAWTVPTRVRGIIACSAVLVGKSSIRSRRVDSSRGSRPAVRELGDDVREIACGGRLFDVVHGLDPQRTQQQVRRLIEQRDQPAEQPQIPVRRGRQRAGDRLRHGDREILRHQLAEKHLHQGAEDQRHRRPDRDTERCSERRRRSSPRTRCR